MGKLPQKQDRKQHPGFRGQPSRRGRVADHRRHRARDSADRGGPPGALLERRIEEQVAGQRKRADPGGKRSLPATNRRIRPPRAPPRKRAPALEASRPEGNGRSAVRRIFSAIGLPFQPLVERGRAGSNQSRSEQGVEQSQDAHVSEEFAPTGRPGKSKEVTDSGAHQNQPGDPRLGQLNVIAHVWDRWPPAPLPGLPMRCIRSGASFPKPAPNSPSADNIRLAGHPYAHQC